MSVVAAAVVVAVAMAGCGDGPRTLTAADVMPIPPGTALGSTYSGDYVTVQGHIDACHCRSGLCSTLFVRIGEPITVTQTDGTLDFMTSASSALPAHGAIDADGAFRVNAMIEQPGNVQYDVASGRFHLANGVPSSFDLTQELTVVNGPYNCDLRASSNARFVGATGALVSSGDAPGSPAAPDGAVAVGIAVGITGAALLP